jgi:class 3 adenylate cyclase
LYDVSIVDLPGGGAGRSVADIRALESAAAPSRVANTIYGPRHFLGRVFGWDHVQLRPEDSLLSRLSERDRRDSEITPDTPVGSFLLLYQFPGEALSETRNATVHGYVCTALAPTASGYRLYWGIYVIPVSWLTRPYLIAVEVRRDLHADEAKMGKGPVSCPSCGHENPAGARFCNDCGAHLAAPTITREPRSYTPRHLVEKILASESALRGERKLVTVLFADVVRSMELAERVDPEEWHRLLDRLFRTLAGGVHRYEGTINQYTGDGIMALFGAPIAHEDHVQRACAAALDLARELGALAEDVRWERGLEFAVRMGLNSGEVVVGRIGDDLRMDYTAQGHVVGLAARVQQLAPPGGIAVTEQTARLAAGFFHFLDRGEQRLKGASVPVRVFELRGPGQIRSRLESSRARGFSRFVGRERELALLERALRETQSGRPTVVLVTAEPGAGKSRLCHEFVERAHGVALHYARALSHGRMLPFHVIVALARSLFGVGEGASPSDVRDAVRRGLGNAQPDPIALDFWLDLLGVSDHVPAPSGLDPEERRARLFQSLLDLIRARARRELTLLWVEDLHWLDPASEVALEILTKRLLAPESAGSRILLLATTRPEYRPVWSSRVAGLSVAPLALQDSRTLLDDWLGSDDVLAPLRARIEARARGNPLFIEEMIRSLVERGVLRGERGVYGLAATLDEITLPETVQAVLASRIDRLADRDKDVLQAAAVVGRDVPIELLRAVVDLPAPELAASLERLSTAELLGPAESPGEHAFRHPLAQEVAYRTQLLDRRRGTHAAIARALLSIHGPAAATHAGLLAHHFDEAGERLEAARWHEQAGRRVARSDPADGVRHCRRVTTLLAAVPESRETLILELTSRIALLEIGPMDACAGSRATWGSTSHARSALRSSPKGPTQCSSSRCAQCWPTHSLRSAASLPPVRPPSVL